jgi:hypothetical protein
LRAALDSSSLVTSSWPSTGTIGPVQIACEPIVAMKGVTINTASAEIAVPRM